MNPIPLVRVTAFLHLCGHPVWTVPIVYRKCTGVPKKHPVLESLADKSSRVLVNFLMFCRSVEVYAQLHTQTLSFNGHFSS